MAETWFKARLSWAAAIMTLSDAEAGRLLKALYKFATTEEEDRLWGREAGILAMAIESVRQDRATRREIARTRAAAGRAGAATRWQEKESHSDIANDGKCHSDIANDGKCHSDIANDGKCHSDIANDGKCHSIFETEGKIIRISAPEDGQICQHASAAPGCSVVCPEGKEKKEKKERTKERKEKREKQYLYRPDEAPPEDENADLHADLQTVSDLHGAIYDLANEFGLVPSGAFYERLNGLMADYSPEWVWEGLQCLTDVTEQKRSLGYLRGILRRRRQEERKENAGQTLDADPPIRFL